MTAIKNRLCRSRHDFIWATKPSLWTDFPLCLSCPFNSKHRFVVFDGLTQWTRAVRNSSLGSRTGVEDGLPLQCLFHRALRQASANNRGQRSPSLCSLFHTWLGRLAATLIGDPRWTYCSFCSTLWPQSHLATCSQAASWYHAGSESSRAASAKHRSTTSLESRRREFGPQAILDPSDTWVRRVCSSDLH